MTEGNEFHSGPDVALGKVLREHLAGSDVPRFLARLRQAIVLAERETVWDTLSRWALPGLVAASLVAATLAWIGTTRASPAESSQVPVQVIVAGQETAGDLLVAAVVEGR